MFNDCYVCIDNINPHFFKIGFTRASTADGRAAQHSKENENQFEWQPAFELELLGVSSNDIEAIWRDTLRYYPSVSKLPKFKDVFAADVDKRSSIVEMLKANALAIQGRLAARPDNVVTLPWKYEGRKENVLTRLNDSVDYNKEKLIDALEVFNIDPDTIRMFIWQGETNGWDVDCDGAWTLKSLVDELVESVKKLEAADKRTWIDWAGVALQYIKAHLRSTCCNPDNMDLYAELVTPNTTQVNGLQAVIFVEFFSLQVYEIVDEMYRVEEECAREQIRFFESLNV